MHNAGRHRTRSGRRYDQSGQSITELALILPILAILLLGLVEVAGAYGAKNALQAATFHADRIGAINGNGGNDQFHCPSAASATGGWVSDPVDLQIVQAIAGASGIDMNNVASIQVYKAGVHQGVVSTSGSTPLMNQYVSPFYSGSQLYASMYNWPSCDRKTAEPADSIAVHIAYRYHPITPLLGMTTLNMDDQTVQRLNPTKNDNPCPVPDAPNVTVQWNGPQPSTNDTVTVVGASNTTSVKVYASSSAGGSSTLVGTIIGSSGSVTYTHDPAPASNPTIPKGWPVFYQAVGNNYCGDGDISDPVSNGQPSPPIAPAIITATASGTSDYVSWVAQPNISSYTITQTVYTNGSSAASNVTTVTGTPPVTYTSMADTYWTLATASVPVTVSYVVAGTNTSLVTGPPSAAIVVTPTVPPPPTSSLAGWWKFDEGAGTTTADSSSSGLHQGTLNGGVSWSVGPTGYTQSFTNAVAFNGTSGYVAAASPGTGLPSTNTPQSISWWMNPTLSADSTGDHTLIALTNSGSTGIKISFHSGNFGVWLSGTTTSPWGTNLLQIPVSSVPAGWHHYVWTFDGTSNQLYIDTSSGVPVKTGANQWSSSVAPTRLEFGRSPTPDYYKGAIDDVRIYTRALTALEVQTLDKQQ